MYINKSTKVQKPSEEEIRNEYERLLKGHKEYIENKENPLAFDKLIKCANSLTDMDEISVNKEIERLRTLYSKGSKARDELWNERYNLSLTVFKGLELLSKKSCREISRRKYQVKKEFSKLPEIKEYEKAFKEFKEQRVGNARQLKMERLTSLIEGQTKDNIQADRQISTIHLKEEFLENYKYDNKECLLDTIQKRKEALIQVERDVAEEFKEERQQLIQLGEYEQALYNLLKLLSKDEDNDKDSGLNISDFTTDEYTCEDESIEEEDGYDEEVEAEEKRDELLRNQMLQLASDVESDKINSLTVIINNIYKILQEYRYTGDEITDTEIFQTISGWKELLIKEFKTDNFSIIKSKKDGIKVVRTVKASLNNIIYELIRR